MSASKDEYILRRDYPASVRLNAQHFCWCNTFGYLVHPKIPIDGEDLSIIDVGTGTGVWPLAVHQELQGHIKVVVGADISDAQFPHYSWLPNNVELIKLDALDPNGPPKELRGRFDIVHARYLATLVKDNKPDQLIQFFFQLLKPGGYLQWGEPDVYSTNIKSVGGCTDGIEFLMTALRGLRVYDWQTRIMDRVEVGGFEIVATERAEPLTWQRGWYIDIWCMIVDEAIPALDMPAEKVREMIDKAHAESKKGNWMGVTFLNMLARKKI